MSGSGRGVVVDHPSGTRGRLEPVGPWSARVVDAAGPDLPGWLLAADAVAAGRGWLDLRSEHPLPGATALAGSEHVRPVPVVLADAAATADLGRRLAEALRPGDLLVLSGPLGAGKTTLTAGIGAALGVRGRVTSPTFVLARVHRPGPDGRIPLVHVDAYRLRGPDGAAGDLDDLDLDLALETAVTVVEWGEGLVERLSEARLDVVLGRSGDGRSRTALVRPHGVRWSVLGRARRTG